MIWNRPDDLSKTGKFRSDEYEHVRIDQSWRSFILIYALVFMDRLLPRLETSSCGLETCPSQDQAVEERFRVLDSRNNLRRCKIDPHSLCHSPLADPLLRRAIHCNSSLASELISEQEQFT
jgi:hypothetical protein